MLRLLLRLVGLIFLGVAVVAFLADAVKSIAASTIVLTPLGKYWFDVSRETLNAAQAAVQRYMSPWLWDPVIQTLLTWPAFLTMGVVGLVFLWLGDRKPRRRR